MNAEPGTALPFYSLFGGGSGATVTTGTPVIKTGTVDGRTFSVSMVPLAARTRPRARSTTTTPGRARPRRRPRQLRRRRPRGHDSEHNVRLPRARDFVDHEHNELDNGAGYPGHDDNEQLDKRDSCSGLVAAVTSSRTHDTSRSSTLSPNSLVPAGTLTPVRHDHLRQVPRAPARPVPRPRRRTTTAASTTTNADLTAARATVDR